MKPRLPVEALTDEDWDIWQLLHGGRDFNGEWHMWIVGATDADRRDADLMLKLTRVQVGEWIDKRTWVSGGPDGEFIPVRPAALWVVE